jgi:hypothetical protein
LNPWYVAFTLLCLPFPDDHKNLYFAVFFPSLRDGDKSNHFGELKTTTSLHLHVSSFSDSG